MISHLKANSIVSSVLHTIELIIFIFTFTAIKHMFPVKTKNSAMASTSHPLLASISYLIKTSVKNKTNTNQ